MRNVRKGEPPFRSPLGFFQCYGMHVMPSICSCYSLIQECIKRKDLETARRIRCRLQRTGAGFNVFLVNHIIRMFALCGSLLESNEVFRSVPNPNAFTWSIIISVTAKAGYGRKAVELYSCMQQTYHELNEHVFSAILTACASIRDLQLAKIIHVHVIDLGFELAVSVGNALVDAYAKCASVEDAFKIHNGLPNPDIVTWGTIIAAHVQNGNILEALHLFYQLQHKGLQPNEIIFSSIIKACSITSDWETGRIVHMNLIEKQFESEDFIGSCLIDMYTGQGNLQDAQEVFERLPKRDAVTWTSMISAFIHHGHYTRAFHLFIEMNRVGIVPNLITFLSIARAFSNNGSLEDGLLLHGYIVETGIQMDMHIGSALVDLYSKCYSLNDACRVFEKLNKPDVVVWDAMIAGCAQHACKDTAMQYFVKMQNQGLRPNKVSFIIILQTALTMEAISSGRLIHAQIIENGYEQDTVIGNCLVNIYSKYGYMCDARMVFDSLMDLNVITWGALISGYIEHGCIDKSMELFRAIHECDIQVDETILIHRLKVSSCLDEGGLIHAYAIENNNNYLSSSIWNSLVSIYCEFQKIEDARKTFDTWTEKDVASCTSMIQGFSNSGLINEALQMFRQMQNEGVFGNQLTFIAVLKACSCLYEGKRLHSYILCSDYGGDMLVANTLIDMYARCGDLNDACVTFEKLPMKDTVTWNVIIARCSEMSNHMLVLDYFKGMQCEGMKPDGATFSSVLTACIHLGLVKEGCQYFSLMHECYNIEPTMDHLNTILDLLGRAGWLEEAGGFILSSPLMLDQMAWFSLLSHCKLHGNASLGKTCFNQLVKID